MSNKSLLLFLAILGCSDYSINKITEKPAPDIEVTPLEYSFSDLNVGETLGKDFLIKNVGNDKLYVHSIELVDESSSFYLRQENLDSLDPQEEFLLVVEYSPLTYSYDGAFIELESNDPDEPLVKILLNGTGSAPIIKVTPDYHDFNLIELGCEDDLTVTIENVGNVDLEISDIDYLANVPADMIIDDFFGILESLPTTIVPGGDIALNIGYIPLDTLNDASILKIHSNDPMTPVADAEQYGNGIYGNLHSETFYQDGISDVDILFVIDNSGSMLSNQVNLKNNFSSFISVFSSAGANYQIAFITTDNAEFVNGEVVTSMSPDPILSAESIIDSIGGRGSGVEKGIDYAYAAISPGGDAEPGGMLTRESARFVLIFVSDEKDYSTSWSAADLISKMASIKSSISMITAHAVAGDYPSGCASNGGAEFGAGYHDVVSAMMGTFLSICSNDWGIDLDEIARDSLSVNQFVLEHDAIEESISVMIDGIYSSDWIFEESTNSVILSITPIDGSEIVIDYASWSCR
jgi:hypothetical protein